MVFLCNTTVQTASSSERGYIVNDVTSKVKLHQRPEQQFDLYRSAICIIHSYQALACTHDHYENWPMQLEIRKIGIPLQTPVLLYKRV